jgi:hypothetical protein
VGHKKWNIYTEPSAGELRAPRPADEAPVRHTRRRSTKLWCRGKVGVEHAFGIRLKRAVVSREQQPHKYGRGRYRYLDGYHCGWSWWLWRLYDDWSYSCGHERFCTGCGKIFTLEPTGCPEYDQHPKPTISAQEAERRRDAEREAERETARVAREAVREAARATRRKRRQR